MFESRLLDFFTFGGFILFLHARQSNQANFETREVFIQAIDLLANVHGPVVRATYKAGVVKRCTVSIAQSPILVV